MTPLASLMPTAPQTARSGTKAEQNGAIPGESAFAGLLGALEPAAAPDAGDQTETATPPAAPGKRLPPRHILSGLAIAPSAAESPDRPSIETGTNSAKPKGKAPPVDPAALTDLPAQPPEAPSDAPPARAELALPAAQVEDAAPIDRKQPESAPIILPSAPMKEAPKPVAEPRTPIVPASLPQAATQPTTASHQSTEKPETSEQTRAPQPPQSVPHTSAPEMAEALQSLTRQRTGKAPTAPPLQNARMAQGIAMPASDIAALSTTPAAPAPAQATAPAAAPQPSFAAGPQDFEALIDRLVQAREAAQPQSVRMQVSHSDFGPVSLRFDSTGSALNVTLHSADPDFAPTIQQALVSERVAASHSSQGAQADSQGHNASGQGSPMAGQQGQQDRPATRQPGQSAASFPAQAHGAEEDDYGQSPTPPRTADSPYGLYV